jgi:hypothetical protein
MLMALSGLGEGHRATIREKQVNDASPIAVSERIGEMYGKGSMHGYARCPTRSGFERLAQRQ